MTSVMFSNGSMKFYEAEWVKFWAPVQGKTFYHNIATGENTREKHADETKIRDATSIEQAQYEAREQAEYAARQQVEESRMTEKGVWVYRKIGICDGGYWYNDAQGKVSVEKPSLE